MNSLFELCVFFALILVIVYWWRSREQQTTALGFATKYCQERNIQLLDQTLVFQKFAFTKTKSNRKVLGRVYSFDFCDDGEDRHSGEIVLAGYAVIRVMLETEQLEITQY